MLIIKTIILGIIEGITEWLPISSTGHLILANEFIKLDMSEDFIEVYNVVIQLGAIMAVVVLFFKDLFPWGFGKTKEDTVKTFNLWFKIAVSCIPCIIVGLFLDDYIDEHFYNPWVVSIMLILYGVFFLDVKCNKHRVKDIDSLSYKDAFKVGLYQALAVIPGTSRSGATITGGLLCGIDKEVITKYTFYLGIPVMFGASFLKLIKYGLAFTASELLVLLVGMLSAFIVSIISIKYLLKYIRKHDFKVFGIYRIVLGIIVLMYFLLK